MGLCVEFIMKHNILFQIVGVSDKNAEFEYQ